MSRYQAPFGPEGPAPIDPDIARKLLTVALEKGGDYADLYFEHSSDSSIAMED